MKIVIGDAKLKKMLRKAYRNEMAVNSDTHNLFIELLIECSDTPELFEKMNREIDATDGGFYLYPAGG